jgi:hypothetical protein
MSPVVEQAVVDTITVAERRIEVGMTTLALAWPLDHASAALERIMVAWIVQWVRPCLAD